MQTEEIEKILLHTLKSTFVGVFAKDEIPNTPLRPMAIIVNTDSSSKPGTHWMAVFLFRNGGGEFFDSYGRYPVPKIERYLNKHASRGWSYNLRAVQSRISTLCGAYCLLNLQARNSNKTLSLKSSVDRLFPFTNSWWNDCHVQQLMESRFGVYIPLIDRDAINFKNPK